MTRDDERVRTRRHCDKKNDSWSIVLDVQLALTVALHVDTLIAEDPM